MSGSVALLLAEIGRVNEVTVSQEEINKQIIFEAQQFPGQEKQVFDYYRSSPQAAESARAPVYEDKVVDLIFEKASVTEKAVSTVDLKKAYEKMEEEDEKGEADKAKKAAARKSTAKKPAAKKAPAKKAAAKK